MTPLSLDDCYRVFNACEFHIDQIISEGYLLYVIDGDYLQRVALKYDTNLDQARIKHKISVGKVKAPGHHAGKVSIDLKLYEWFIKMFRQHVLLDIGSNYGRETIRYLTYNRDVLSEKFGAHMPVKTYAFDPSPAVFCSRLNYDLHNVDVSLFNAAVTNVDGPMSFFIDKAMTTGGSTLKPSNVDRRKGITRGVTLDGFVKDYKIDCPCFFKVDVQGAEYAIIQGGEKFFNDRKCAGIMEFSPLAMSQISSPNNYLREILEKFCIIEIGHHRSGFQFLKSNMVDEYIEDIKSREEPWTDFLFASRSLEGVLEDFIEEQSR